MKTPAYYDWQDAILKVGDGQSIIEALSEPYGRVVDIDIGPDGIRLVEACDGYFGVTLTKAQAEKLIEELKALCAKL